MGVAVDGCRIHEGHQRLVRRPGGVQAGLRSTRRANAPRLTRLERHGLEEGAPRSVEDDEGQLSAVARPVSGPTSPSAAATLRAAPASVGITK